MQKVVESVRKVCDGCWRVGVCVKALDTTLDEDACRCTCDGGRNWLHTDDPRN